MANIEVYFTFNGNCREAMEFYKSCLGGELNIMTVGESPMADKMPAGSENNVLHSILKNGDLVLMGSDMGGGELTVGNNLSVSLNCSSETELRNYFSKLAVGGNITHEPTVEFWGSMFGHLTDKFGVNWLLNVPVEKK